VPKIYMQEFWVIATVHHHSIWFKMDNKKHIVNMESFREMLHICPRLPGQTFDEPPFEEEILAFFRSLRHIGEIKRLIDVNINKLYQPWRSFAAVINKCLSGKSSGYDKRNDEQDDDDAQDNDDDQEDEGDADEDDQEEGSDDEHASDEEDEEFIHPNLSTHNEEEIRDEESFDPIPKTPENTDDEGNGKDNFGTNDDREEGQDEEDEEDELYRDVNINLGRGVQMADVHTTQEFEDSHVTLTLVNPDGQRHSSSVSSQFVTSMLNPTPDAGIESIFETTSQMDVQTLTSVAPLPVSAPTLIPSTIATTLKANFSEFIQTNQFAGAVSSIPRIVQRYMDQWMDEAVKNVNEQLEAKVLTRSSNSSNTSYAVAADLLEMELKKILIEKMEDIYGDTATLKIRHDDDADKDEEPSAGSDWGSNRRREGKEPESVSAPKKKATRSASKSTQGSKSRQTSASESTTAEEPMQTTHEMEEPSHPEFATGADDQPIVEPSQHPQWFSQQKKPPTLDRDWNKALSATHRSIQQWISELAKQSNSRSSFNELMDTHVDFSAFLMNRLKVDTLTPELLAGPTYELIKGSCKSTSSHKYTTSVTKTKAADYRHIKWIEDLVPWTMWIKEPIGYDKHALWGISHWGRKSQQFYGFSVNRESARDIYSKRRIIAVTKLKIVKEADKSDSRRTLWFQRLSLNVYTKHHNPKACGRPSSRCRKLPEEAQPNKAGYNRLMRIDELHKFSDGALTDVRTALDDRLKGIRMKYLPHLIWRKSDKDRVVAMIQAIDKQLKTRRIIRSLESDEVLKLKNLKKDESKALKPSIEENGVTRPKKYSELSATEAIQADCDVKATSIILQGLPPEERECKLYDEFDKFAYKKEETLREFYLRFSLLLNDMNIYNMKLEQFQVNIKFLNTLPPEWRNL
nr:hypothetical protein [Tanacetum cinerariifolium]